MTKLVIVTQQQQNSRIIRPKATIAIDPGGTTGIAWRMPDGQYVTETAKEAQEVWSVINEAKNILELIIYEQFAAQLISEHGLHTVRVIGGIQALAHIYGIPVEGRPPQTRYCCLDQAQAYLNADRKATGERHVVHEADALAHLMSYDQTGPLPQLSKPVRTRARSYRRSRA